MSNPCAECGKAVYFMEQKKEQGKFFHLLCYGVWVEKNKRAPVHNIAEETFTGKDDPHYQRRETGKVVRKPHLDMEKATGFADSNIANLGTQLEKDVKKAAALSDPEWREAAEAEPEVGLKIWRIEKFEVKKWPKEDYGSFYQGDSYIVLRTYMEKNKFLYDIFFWLGRDTTQDEAGTAAYKTVELDDCLNGLPVQHREVQDHESELFLKQFEKQGGIRIMQGGIETGFTHVEPKSYRPRLLHLKGRRNVRVVEVALQASSLNSGDVFVLDAGLTLYQWQGRGSGPMERARAASLCRALDEERGGKPHVITLAEKDAPNLDSHVADFWALLPGSKEDVRAEDDLDEAFENSRKPKLYRVSDASGELKMTLEKEGEVMRADFDSNDVFILDVHCEIFVWIGQGATAQERKNGMKFAQDYLAANNLPNWLPISRILERGENETFISYLQGEKRIFSKSEPGIARQKSAQLSPRSEPPAGAMSRGPGAVPAALTSKDQGWIKKDE